MNVKHCHRIFEGCAWFWNKQWYSPTQH